MMEKLIWIICIWGCAVFFFCLGLYAVRRRKPMWFWAGSEVSEESIANVQAYNRENGRMWKLYSVPFWIAGILYFYCPVGALILLILACSLGIGWLIRYYKRIEQRHRKSAVWQRYYLYRLCFTGVTEWNYVKEEGSDNIRENSESLTTNLAVPNCPLNIASKQYGSIISEFDYDSTLVPGLTRYGRGEGQREVFALQWEETGYILKIQGYLPIHISGKDIITFVQGEKEIARITPAQGVHIAFEFVEADHIKRLEIDPEFIPVLEIMGAFIGLQFAF